MAHNRIRVTFGTNAEGEQLYCWHSGAQVTCNQPGGTRGRQLLQEILVKDETLTIHATKAEFTIAPKPGDNIQMGTTLATARTLRIDSVKTTHMWAHYEIDMLDPNLATTEPEG
jgi:hypothetical protein